MQAGSLVHKALPMTQEAAQGLSGCRRCVVGVLGGAQPMAQEATQERSGGR